MATATGLELILNACERSLQIIVLRHEQVVCSEQWAATDRATEILAPALQHMASALDFSFADLQRIACVHGPGSFTGIRLVLTTCAALRRTSGARAAALDHMQALAQTVCLERSLPHGTPVHVLTHARRDLVHYQCFTAAEPQQACVALAPVTLLTPAQTLAQIRRRGGHVCGTALSRNAAVLLSEDRADETSHDAAAGTALCVFLPGLCDPSVPALCLLARHASYADHDVEPLYVRPCDAVENLPQLAARQGLTADAAVSALHSMLASTPRSAI